MGQRRSEFARHFGPAALRREVRARYGISVKPRRVASGEPLWRALDGREGGATLVAAWAAAVEPRDEHAPPVEAVCAAWRRSCANHIVVWGAACVMSGARLLVGNDPYILASGWIGQPRCAPLIVGRSTGPAVWGPGAWSRPNLRFGLYATNDNPTCGGFDCAESRLRVERPEASRPLARAYCTAAGRRVPLGLRARAGVIGVPCQVDYVYARLDPRHVDAVGVRRGRWSRATPRLTAGRATYRDAPTRAAAVAALGRRGEAAAAYACR